MVISTNEHDYPIVGVKQRGEVYDCYICRNICGGGLCRIFSIKDRSLFAELAGWLTDNINRDSFTDYIEHFIFEGKFCLDCGVQAIEVPAAAPAPAAAQPPPSPPFPGPPSCGSCRREYSPAPQQPGTDCLFPERITNSGTSRNPRQAFSFCDNPSQ